MRKNTVSLVHVGTTTLAVCVQCDQTHHFAALENTDTLAVLILRDCRIHDLTILASQLQLSLLILDNCPQISNIHPLKHLPLLKALYITDCLSITMSAVPMELSHLSRLLINGKRLLPTEETLRRQCERAFHKIESLTSNAYQTPISDRDFAELMEWIYSLGLACSRHQTLLASPWFLQLLEQSQEAMFSLSQPMEQFLRDLEKTATDFTTPYGDFYRSYDAPWRLSALQFWEEFYPDAYEAMAGFIQEWLNDIHSSFKHVIEVMGAFDDEIPDGMPSLHWWWSDSFQPADAMNRRNKQGPCLPFHPNRQFVYSTPPSNPECLDIE